MSLTREGRWRELADGSLWDVVVIGGGATGLGTALEAATRGYRTALVERDDFAQGTSSRSTKLVHGGVRYLEQMNVTLVLDALRERGLMLRNAPHIAHALGFVVPVYGLWGLGYYGAGLKVYEALSGKLSLGKSELLSARETTERLPTVRREGLRGGVLYRDGQFDDARYAVSLMRTLEDQGGLALNYAAVTGLLREGGRVCGVEVRDCEADRSVEVRARVVINATGAFSGGIARMDEAAEAAPALALSQGSHLVLPREFLPSADALMIPKTSDGRVLFAIPWHGRLVVGTTDVPVAEASAHPRALPAEHEFLVEHVEKFLGRTVQGSDVCSMWSGLRPLVKSAGGSTSKLSRDHQVSVLPGGLVSVIGGKWTTYRKMGEDTIDKAAPVAGLKASPSRTAELPLHGWRKHFAPDTPESARVYGTDLEALEALAVEDPSLANQLHARLPYRRAEVVWAVRQEQARTTEDVLARRTRALFLDARAAMEAAEDASRLVATELGRDETARQRDLESFLKVAQGYVYRC